MNQKYVFEGKFGIERETLRLDKSGRLSQSSHPFDDPHLERDFCENQLEIITGVNDSVKDAIAELAYWDRLAKEKLSQRSETLHIYSNPPYFQNADEIPVAYSGMETSKFNYRKQLEQKYGKPLMLYSGIHFNFSFAEDVGDTVYFHLMKQIFRHSWLLVLLTAASPICDKSLIESGKSGAVFSGYSSMRNSEKGYWNQFVPTLDYTDLSAFVGSIQEYIDDGFLLSPAELYLPIRIKPKGVYTLENLNHGIDHIELRMFDLNPLSDVGIFSEDLEFSHLLMLYLLQFPDFDFTPQMQEKAVFDHKQSAKFNPDKVYFDRAIEILNDMKNYFSEYENAKKIIAYQMKKLTENKRYCVKIYEEWRRKNV